jgi:predicted metalloprotease with PDZ domain
MSRIGASDMPDTSKQPNEMESTPRLRREARLASRDRSRLAALVAACTLTGVAVGFSLSALVTVHHAATLERAQPRVVAVASQEPITWLGVAIRDAGYDTRGAVVLEVFAGSPADRAGIEPGDRILSVAGSCARTARDVVTLIRRAEAGERVPIGVLRRGERVWLEAELSSLPASALDPRVRYRTGR